METGVLLDVVKDFGNNALFDTLETLVITSPIEEVCVHIYDVKSLSFIYQGQYGDIYLK